MTVTPYFITWHCLKKIATMKRYSLLMIFTGVNLWKMRGERYVKTNHTTLVLNFTEWELFPQKQHKRNNILRFAIKTQRS